MAEIGSTLSKYASGSEISSLLESDKLGVFLADTYLELDGVTNDYSNLYSLINTTINGVNAEIWFKSGECIIGSNLTIPSNIKLKFLNGAKISPNSGITITINGEIEAGFYQIFTGSGSVTGSIKNTEIYPEWWGAKFDNSTDDTNSINSTLTSAYQGSNLVIFPHRKSFKFSDSLNIKENQCVDFNYCDGYFTGTGIAINCNLTSDARVQLLNELRIRMTENSLTQKGVYLNNVSGGIINVRTYNGAYGIYSENSYEYFVEGTCVNPKLAGYYHQGDGGAEIWFGKYEIFFNDGFTGRYGLEIERTTTADVGGYYLLGVKVVRNPGSFAEQGIYCHGAAGGQAIIALQMTNGASDGWSLVNILAGYYPLKLENVSNLRATGVWFTGVGILNTDHTTFGDANVAYGFHFKGTGNVSNAFLADNISCGEGEAFFFDATATVTNFYYNNIRQKPGEKISSNMDKITASYNSESNKVFTDPSTGSGALCIENSNDSTKKKFLRIDENNQLVMLNSTFGAAILEITNGGSIKMSNSSAVFSIGSNQILKDRITGWTTPTGTELRTGFDTSTATTEQLAQTLMALIKDLKAHGLIGL